jgi:hypothetical protein
LAGEYLMSAEGKIEQMTEAKTASDVELLRLMVPDARTRPRYTVHARPRTYS